MQDVVFVYLCVILLYIPRIVKTAGNDVRWCRKVSSIQDRSAGPVEGNTPRMQRCGRDLVFPLLRPCLLCIIYYNYVLLCIIMYYYYYYVLLLCIIMYYYYVLCIMYYYVEEKCYHILLLTKYSLN